MTTENVIMEKAWGRAWHPTWAKSRGQASMRNVLEAEGGIVWLEGHI